ncbi:C2 domain [Popillia japonica]|uniref:C2 domain n=1 Tax=Popillia japonica TaxID=7064 RepID=A0AAW1N6M4_POPJA
MGLVRSPSPAVLPSEEANHSDITGQNSEDEWKDTLPYQITAGIIIIVMALVLFAAVSYQCAATWRWILDKTCRDTSDTESALSKQAAIRISHSLPDLQTEPLKQEYVQEHKEIVKKNMHDRQYLVKYVFQFNMYCY